MSIEVRRFIIGSTTNDVRGQMTWMVETNAKSKVLHGIPEPTIRRRYRQGIANFGTLYAPIIDQWIIYDGSDRPAVGIISDESGTKTILDDYRFDRLTQWSPELLP